MSVLVECFPGLPSPYAALVVDAARRLRIRWLHFDCQVGCLAGPVPPTLAQSACPNEWRLRAAYGSNCVDTFSAAFFALENGCIASVASIQARNPRLADSCGSWRRALYRSRLVFSATPA